MFKITNLTDVAANNFETIFNMFHNYCELFDVDYDKLVEHIVEVSDSTDTDYMTDGCILNIKFDNTNKLGYIKYSIAAGVCSDFSFFVDLDCDGYCNKWCIDFLKNVIGIKTERNYVNTDMINDTFLNGYIEAYNYNDMNKLIKNVEKNTNIVANIDKLIKDVLVGLNLDVSKSYNKWYFAKDEIKNKTNYMFVELGENKRLYIVVNEDFEVASLNTSKKTIIDEQTFKNLYNSLK